MADNISDALATIVGAENMRCGAEIGDHYRFDIGRKFESHPAWLARPATTDEVSAVMKLAHAHALPVTVIGGQSGTCGAAVPTDGGLALSLDRMNRVQKIDPLSMTMTVEAGCILQSATEQAEAQGTFLPLDLGARGSAMIGGVIGTNAGGNRVIRWGMMRDMVLGLEAVLADGTVISSLTGMIKDNAGYNWKHLLIGSEGTLAVVTRAVLRLRPLPTTQQTAIIAMGSFEDAIRAMRRLEAGLSGQLSSFELMWEDFFATHSEAQLAQRPRPMALGHPIYALVEAMGGDEDSDTALFQRTLMGMIQDGLVADAVIAQSARERDALWAVRDNLSPGLTPLRPFISYDISMAIADMPAVVERARNGVRSAFPDATMLFYGHAGDGNLHVIVSIGRMDEAIQRTFDDAVYGAVRTVGGSIAAEHGVGTTRKEYLGWTRSAEEIAVMRAIKHALDPTGILNPGKIF